jgi:hypothetical protein
MSSGRARDIRYGRRGGGWIDKPRRPAPVRQRATRAAAVLEPEVLFHPDTIAARRAHDRHCTSAHKDGEPCPAVVDPDDLAELWAGRARMARARRAAGQPRDRLDLAALDRHDGPDRETRR